MHETGLILTLTAALTVGLGFGYTTNLLRLSPIVGYLLAGIVIGPFTPGFIADQNIAYQLAEVGVMLLMFGVGLHFHVEDLLAVRRIAIPGAIAQIAAATTLGSVVATSLGWSMKAGIVYGLCLSVASTVVLTRILVDNRQLHTRTGHVAMGWLIVEDLFTVLVLVILPILAQEGATGSDLAGALGLLALKLTALIGATFVLGRRVVPWIFGRVAQTGSQELFTLTVLATALGIAVGSAKLFDVSMALGAFLAGMVVGKSEFSLRAASDALPLRDAFGVLFFVSVGMLLDPAVLIEHWPLIAATLGVVIGGKTLAAFVLVLVLGYPVRIALGVSVALAQIGEFSFILATLGQKLGLIDGVAMNALVATAIVSITLNPLLFRLVPRLDAWIAAHPRLTQLLTRENHPEMTRPFVDDTTAGADRDSRAVVVGYGPVGQAVCSILEENGVAPTVIELNLETTRRLRSSGKHVVYGDASRRDVLASAGLDSAQTLILSATGILNLATIVREAKAINPTIHIIARTTYTHDLHKLTVAGCASVVSEESEVALSLSEIVLRNLGATAEQIERERLRVRSALSKDSDSPDGEATTNGPPT